MAGSTGELQGVFSQMPNEDLYEVVAGGRQSDYLPEALEIAQAEWRNRRLSPDQIKELDRVRAQRLNQAGLPLGWLYRLFVLAFPSPHWFAHASKYSAEGYERMARDIRTFMISGWVMWFALAAGYVLLR